MGSTPRHGVTESLYSHADAAPRTPDPNRRQRAAYAHVLRNTSGGPPTDNRRVQADAVKGEIYLAISTVANAVQGVTVTITQLRRNRSLRKIEKALRRRAYRRGRPVTKAMPTPDAHANDKQRKPVVGGPLADLFERPNRQQTLPAFLAMWRLQEMLTGNVLFWGNPDGVGRVREIFILPTALCLWQPPTAEYPRGAWRVHQPGYGLAYGQLAGNYAVIPAEQVTHYKHLGHPLYHWDGLSPLTAVGKWVDVIDSIDRGCWATMDRGARRGTLLIVPGLTPDEARAINEDLRRDKAGPDNSGVPWVIGTTSAESKPTVQDPPTGVEMDFQASRQGYAGLTLAAMGVPPIAANLKEAGSHAQLYASIKQFRDLTLIPWLAAVAAALNAGVVATWDDGDDGLRLQFDLQSILNEDLAEQSKTRQIANGLTSHNQNLRGDNLPPHPDPMAEVLPTDLFNQYLQQKHLPPPAPPPGQPGAAPPAEQDPDALLAGLDGGPTAGDAPKPPNKAGKGSLPPQAKALDAGAAWERWVKKNAGSGPRPRVVRKAADAQGKREGEVWRGESGHYFTLKGGHVVPAKDPAATGGAAAQRPPATPVAAGRTAASPAPSGVPQSVGEALAHPASADPATLATELKNLDPTTLKAAKEAAGYPGGSVKSDTAQAFIDHVKVAGEAAAVLAKLKTIVKPRDYADAYEEYEHADLAADLGLSLAAVKAGLRALASEPPPPAPAPAPPGADGDPAYTRKFDRRADVPPGVEAAGRAWAAGLPPATVAALRAYVDPDGEGTDPHQAALLNRAVRDGVATASQRTAADAIVAAVRRCPPHGETATYRGVKLSADAVARLRVGGAVAFPTVTSSSLSAQHVGNEFHPGGGGVVYRILSTGGAFIDPLVGHGELEVLHPPAEYTVESVERHVAFGTDRRPTTVVTIRSAGEGNRP